MKIEVTTEMRRFNAAVESADRLLSDGADRQPVEYLLTALRSPWARWCSECPRVADELEAAAKAISPSMNGGDNSSRLCGRGAD